jgi:hypothetical protein
MDRSEGLLAFDGRRQLPQRGRYIALESVGQTNDDEAVSPRNLKG